MRELIDSHPLIGATSIICLIVGGSLIFAFLMQWNRGSLIERSWDRRKEKEEKPNILFDYGDKQAWEDTAKESEGTRFILPTGLALCALGILMLFYISNR